MAPEQIDYGADPQRTSWHPPAPARLQRAIAIARQHRKKHITRTIVLKLHNPSHRKVRALIWAQVQATNMTAHILEALRETPDTIRHDGAFAFIEEARARKAQGARSRLATILADMLSACFTEKQPTATLVSDTTQAPRQRRTHSSQTWTPPNMPRISLPMYPITSALRVGVYREVAKMLLTWYSHISGMKDQGLIDDDTDTELIDMDENNEPGFKTAQADGSTLSDEHRTAYAAWATSRRQYEQAAQTIIPFGRQRGQPLAQVGKRELRWLRARLISATVAEETAGHIAVLLHPERYHADPVRLSEASNAHHPWRRQPRLQRKTRTHRALQRTHELPTPRIRLGILNTEELQRLHAELDEMQTFAVQFAAIRHAVEVYLRPAPAQYPTVPAVMSHEQWAATYATYTDHLTTLRDRIDSAHPDRMDATMKQVQSSARTLRRPNLQPLAFKRAMRPGGHTTFALLYAVVEPDVKQLKQKYRRLSAPKRDAKIAQALAQGAHYVYVLAIAIHGKAAFDGAASPPAVHKDSETGYRPKPSMEQSIGSEPPERFLPNVRPGLYYVNYPFTAFVPPRRTSLLLFPLECGEHYHEQQFLQRIIAQQQQRQQDIFTQWQQTQPKPSPTTHDQLSGLPNTPTADTEPAISADTCLPKAALASARIVSHRTVQGGYDFYVHLPITETTPPVVSTLESVVGFHEYHYGYSYARLNVQGQVIDVGDVSIPAHVYPKANDRWYSNNYVYETVKGMLMCTRTTADLVPNAIVGLENTVWKHYQLNLSYELNRTHHTRPSQQIATVLGYKAPLHGLPRPHTVIISRHQCSACGAKCDPSIRLSYPKTDHCPTCGSTHLQAASSGSDTIQCQEPTCQRKWHVYEPWFTCPTCDYQQIARFNRAILVAQATLHSFVRYYEAIGRTRRRS
ncbi:MAG: hypothetical protein GFH25_541324n25 [Chloroflexi bacterium AL-N10]|nr:hypothetical protein [Chloroflexi bacterium AL-N10]